MRVPCALLTILLVTGVPELWAAEAALPVEPPTVEATYLGLSSGPLREALVVELPEGTILRANGVILTEAQLAARIEEAGEEETLRKSLEKNAPYVVEKMATQALLFAEAKRWAEAKAMPMDQEGPASLIETHLRSLAAETQITDEEVRAYFEEKAQLFAGIKYEQVAEDLRTYLLSEKQEAAIEAHVNGLSERNRVEWSASWLQAHAPAQLDTPVDDARRSGKPTLADFGAGGCSECDRMTPILEELEQTYGERCNVLFVSVRDNPLLGYRYGIRAIPVQVFYDAEGREVYRHVGFFPKEQILPKLAEIGVK